MSNVLEDKVTETVTELHNKDGIEPKQFAISLIFGLIGAVCAIIELYMACKKKPKEALDSIKNPGIIEKVRQRRILKKTFKEDYVKYGPVLAQRMHEVGIRTNEVEMTQMFQEVQAKQYDAHIKQAGLDLEELMK